MLAAKSHNKRGWVRSPAARCTRKVSLLRKLWRLFKSVTYPRTWKEFWHVRYTIPSASLQIHQNLTTWCYK
jgi:hypothetical protein